MLSLAKSRLSGKTLFFIFILCFLASFLTATIINVPTPYTTIQAGIDAAANTDTVLVQPGTYYENINYNGKLITVGSLFLTTQDTTYITSTVIDGNSNGSVVTFNHFEDSSTILCGFTVTNGFAAYGGGIYCYHSSPSLQNLTITGNSASALGGGIYCGYYSSPYLNNVAITDNSSSVYGGGLECEFNSSPYLFNVTITGNSASSYGGGLDCYSNSNPSLENVTISSNSASSNGGGIYCHSSSPILINSILWNDSPEEIYIVSGSVTVTYSDIQDGFTGTGNIDSDPLFVDPGNGDYHLQSTSPCIDAGDPASPLDPDGTIVEMGAYYFPQLNADFTADTTNGEVPLTVNFTDLSTQGSGVIDEWYWEFGDGNNSSLQHPDNEYLLLGIYTVSLTVTDVNDSTGIETKVDYITVNPPVYSGSIWHISITGSDVWGNGSEQYPFATIQHGINNSADTDTVLVQPGTYVENIIYNGKLITVGSLFLTTQDTTYISQTIIDGDSLDSVVKFESEEDSTAVLTGFTITNGFAIDGGGICCRYSSPSLENVTISGNSVFRGGGIYCFNYSSPSLENVTISGNNATQTGGGIFCEHYSSPSLQNVTISGNHSFDEGGGIYCSSSSLSLENVTLVSNSAGTGGGIYCAGSSPVLINSILWNDSPQEIYIVSGSVTATYSDIEGGWTGTGNIDSDPLFVDSGSGDYHLQSTSPCIDAGDPASPLDPDGTIADMGAYYFPQLFADFTSDITNGEVPLTVNFTDISTQGAGVIDEWYWEFGDENNSSLQHPANEYQLPGIYTVSLSVTDVYDSTDIETKVDYITVNPPAYIGPVWHISPTGSDEWGNGSTQYPFATIQHGINTSSNTDTVLVQPGFFYVENINYNGKLITVGSLFLTTQDPTYISSTHIDGNNSGSVVTFENGENLSTVLCGFTIKNGLASGTYPDDSGGGIYCYDSSPSLQNLRIGYNSATYGGGICCSNNSSPSLQNLRIVHNSATYGGGICCSSGSPNLVNVEITENVANEFGGGIFCVSIAFMSLENVTISDNSAIINGGGIYCTVSDLILINSILWNDSPEEIYEIYCSVTATFSDIEGSWPGFGNLDIDPLFLDPFSGDYHLSWDNFPIPDGKSPCIDTGYPGYPDPIYYDPDGTIADMGAYYFDQTITPPQNVMIEIIGTEVHISWDAVTGANSYKVYSSDDPYTGFAEDTSGSFAGESWSAPIGDVKKFYYVTAGIF